MKKGEVVGIIGRNGAGKSTLLKVLSRITWPTEGQGEIHGRVGSLLQVGTGFHPDLTGRENVYLNGVILGMRKAEVDRRFDEIVAFAEVEKFIDTSVLVASLLAFYHQVRFGHVEAGLRTGDKWRPFPEEVNRRVADILADLFFAPTERARQTLLAEGAPPANLHVTGNTGVDALLVTAGLDYDGSRGPLAALPRDRRVVLITAHRRESFGPPFRELCLAVRDLAQRFGADPVQFVYPVHLNPNVRQPVYEILSGLDNVSLLDPLDYLSQVHLMKRSTLILTDSGGIQEEAPSLGVPVLVMREVTERPEGVEAGVTRLVGTRRERIVSEAERLLRDPAAHAAMATGANPYGDGRAAERIVEILLERAGI